MPDLYRITFILTGQGQGCSESYVVPRDGSSTSLVAAQIAQPLAQARAALVAREYKLQAYRTTKIRLADGTAVKRNSDLAIANLGPGGTTSGWRGCQINECVILNGVSAGGDREKKVFARCIPDQVIEDGGQLNMGETIGWFSRLDSFFALLLQYGAGWLQDVPLGNTFNVTGYVINPSFTVTVTFDGTIFNGVAVGTRIPVRLSKINGKSELNGIQQMVVVGNTSATTVEAFSLWPYSFGGTGVRMTTPKPFISAAAWGRELARTHQTGKVSVATRGRSPARPKG